MRRIAAYSVAWGSPDVHSTEENTVFSTNAEAKAARDAAWRAMKKEGRSVSRSVLKGQLRQYWSFGVPCGIFCDVYEINE